VRLGETIVHWLRYQISLTRHRVKSILPSHLGVFQKVPTVRRRGMPHARVGGRRYVGFDRIGADP
jgi:hypothetical protein